ncbi:MAG: tetratricopeptide repeat protein, partial [Deltaproteobacteria bacterium]|nr:tetratricopeptide repeat protein [Deltaproteobacteria bacterium]
GRGEEAVAAYRELIERVGRSEEPALRGQVARAMLGLGVWLGQLDRGEEEAAAYRRLIQQFGESEEPALREQVARALLYLGVTLGQLGRGEEAVAAYRDLIERFGSSEEPALREQVARALLARAQVLFLLQRPSEARAELKEAARLIAAGVPVGLESARTAIELLLVGLPTSEARSAVKQLAQSGDQSVSELARLHLLVVGVLEAEQGSGRAKGSRAARRKRALARVPVELRATVADAARRVARLREAAAADGGGSPG